MRGAGAGTGVQCRQDFVATPGNFGGGSTEAQAEPGFLGIARRAKSPLRRTVNLRGTEGSTRGACSGYFTFVSQAGAPLQAAPESVRTQYSSSLFDSWA
jgi:hypothetical protein